METSTANTTSHKKSQKKSSEKMPSSKKRQSDDKKHEKEDNAMDLGEIPLKKPTSGKSNNNNNKSSTDMLTDSPTAGKETNLKVFISRDHPTFGLLLPASVVIATDEKHAKELLEKELTDRGVNLLSKPAGTMMHLKLKPGAYIIHFDPLENNSEPESYDQDLKFYVCNNHPTVFPITAASTVLAHDETQAKRLFDKKLDGMLETSSQNYKYDLKQLDYRPQAHIINLGEGEF